MTKTTEAATPELLPCPFCGEPAHIDICDRLICIGCKTCGYQRGFYGIVQSTPNDRPGPNGEFYHADAKEKAYAAWNRRAALSLAQPAAQEELRERIKTALEEFDEDLQIVVYNAWQLEIADDKFRDTEEWMLAWDYFKAGWIAKTAATPAARVPEDIVHLVRFLASMYDEFDRVRYQAAQLPPEKITDYLLFAVPVVQGTRNQIDLKRIGDQPHEISKLRPAMDWLLAAPPTIQQSIDQDREGS